MEKLILIIFYFSISINFSAGKINLNFNVTNFLHQRSKRALTFEGGGDIRLVVGPIWSVDLNDPIDWRTLVVIYNLHGGIYQLPQEPLYPWDKFEDIFARSFHALQGRQYSTKSQNSNLEKLAAEQYWADDSRLFVYRVLEDFLNVHNRYHKDYGRSCLLRSICENAQVHQHVGIFAEVLNVILTPGREKIDTAYATAYKAGQSGADCLTLFKDCPMGSNFLDKFLEYL